MRVIRVEDCTDCPYYHSNGYGKHTCFETGVSVSKRGVGKSKAVKLLMSICPLKEVEMVNCCINCEFADINNWSDTCNHEKAEDYSIDGFGSIPDRYSRPYWCPLKKEE